MTPQPGTAGTGDDPLAQLVTQELTVNGQTVTRLVGLAFDSADQTDGVLRFDGTGSTNGITDGSAKVIVNGTVHDVAGAEWVDLSGTRHTVDSWEKVINSQFNVTITGTNGPVQPGNTLDVTVDITNNGTGQDTQTVTLDINNSVGQVDSTSVTLAGGGSTTQTLSWSVPSGQTKQDYTATVASADDTASQTVAVGLETIVWSSASDWDNYSSTSAIVHESYDDLPGDGTLELGLRSGFTNLYLHYPGHDDPTDGSIPEVVRGGSASTEDNPQNVSGVVNHDAIAFDGNDYLEETGVLPDEGDTGGFALLCMVKTASDSRFYTLWNGAGAGGVRLGILRLRIQRR